MPFHNSMRSSLLIFPLLSRICLLQFSTHNLVHYCTRQRLCQTLSLGQFFAKHALQLPKIDLFLQIFCFLSWLQPMASYHEVAKKIGDNARDRFSGWQAKSNLLWTCTILLFITLILQYWPRDALRIVRKATVQLFHQG